MSRLHTARFRPALPPGSSNPITGTWGFQRDPLGFLTRLTANYGDLARFRLLNMRVVVVTHPHHVRRILRDNHTNYDKNSTTYRMVRELFGDGLITSVGGDDWRRQRRLVQPMFHRERIATFGGIIVSTVKTMLDRWDVLARSQERFDVRAAMSELTLNVVVRAVFGQDPEGKQLHRFTAAARTVTDELIAYMRAPVVPLSFPTPGHRRFWSALRTVDDVTFAVIREHAGDATSRQDLLTLLIQARDESGAGMSEQKLRDEVFGMLFAGHETSAATLTWLWYLLAHHPDVEERVHGEVDVTLGGRPPAMADLTRLPYLRRVIDETLRIYPPGWQNSRNARDDDEIGGHYIPAGTDLLWSTWHVHRHRAFWYRLEKFDPDRFAPERIQDIDRSAYIPFGAGGRICVGQHLALAEIQLAAAAIAQRFRVIQTPSRLIAPHASVTLTTAEPVMVTLERRS